MRFQRRQHKLRDRPCLPMLLVSVPVLFIFMIAHFIRTVFSSTDQMHDTAQDGKMEGGILVDGVASARLRSISGIAYIPADSKEANVQRFQVLAQHDDGGHQSTLSVIEWAHLMTQNTSSDLLGLPADYQRQLALNFTQVLRDVPFQGMRFEAKGVTPASAPSTPMEFAVVEDKGLYQFANDDPDPNTFAAHLDCGGSPAGCAFPNLGHNAMLVSPKKFENTKLQAYGHLAAFVRSAPAEQHVQFWNLVASTYLQVLQDRDDANPVWFSTAGDGVAWLHVRFDDRPKYYQYKPFASLEPGAARN